MTTEVDIVNRALISIGSKRKISSLTQDSEEAQIAAAIIDNLRDDLTRMAPWNCATNTANLVYVTSQPGTPENTSPGTVLWQKGQPSPPWVYEYQYPVDCLRPLWVVPQWSTGFAAGVPITSAVTGGAAAWWNAPPQKFKVGIDQFYPVTAATIVNGGTGYATGDVLTLAGTPQGSPPIGAPVQLQVLGDVAGVINNIKVLSQVPGSTSPLGGSYFAIQNGIIGVGSVAGAFGSVSTGVGATFRLTFGQQISQRVILCNQEFAILVYLKQITDPNIADPEFQDAWAAILAARMAMAITEDKALANTKIAEANALIMQARKDDGNEGLTVNDVTPDWIRERGINFNQDYAWGGPYNGFDWGSTFPLY